MRHGVGIIGSGPGVAALHLPTLARFEKDLDVVHIANAGSGRAAILAERVGARSASGIDELLVDDRVSVVVICSPPSEHAAQILACIAAGKRAVFCEKPLAVTVDEAETVIEACRAAGTILLVGTNHLYDSAWGRAKHHLMAEGRSARAISLTLALPPNGRYHEVVTPLSESAAAAGRGAPPLDVPEVAASVVRQLITGLAVHDLPMIRDLAPGFDEVVFARPVAPVGYAVGFRASGIPVRLATVMLPDGADALWTLELTTDTDAMEVSFPPAFVHVGSAAVTVAHGNGTRTIYRIDPEDGYVAEWRAFIELIDGGHVTEYDEMLDDARYTLALADAAAAHILAGVAP